MHTGRGQELWPLEALQTSAGHAIRSASGLISLYPPVEL
nr:MAG TPA: hypothetical protein [Caudoviricetes sp.]